MKCSIITAEYAEQLREIWRQCYPDDPEAYLDFFFKNGFQHSKCIGISDAQHVIGCIYLFPCEIAQTEQKAYYFYAGGVLPAYRGNGYYRQVIAHAVEYCRQEGYEMLCYPLPVLRQFYEHMGFAHQYYHTLAEYSITDTVDNPIGSRMEQVQPQELERIIKAHAQQGDALWCGAMLDYVCAEYRFCRGDVSSLTVDGTEHYLFWRKEEDRLMITETSLPPSLMRRIAGSLMAQSRTSHMTVQQRMGATDAGNRILSSISSTDTGSPSRWFILTML